MEGEQDLAVLKASLSTSMDASKIQCLCTLSKLRIGSGHGTLRQFIGNLIAVLRQRDA